MLTRARALDSTTFVAACGQANPEAVGLTPRGNAPTGISGTVLVSPMGVVVDQLGDGPGMLVADIDPAEVDTARQAIPVLANRRF